MSEKIPGEQIFFWIDVALDNKDIKQFKVDLTGSLEKGEGYATDVIFVKVDAIKKSNEENIELDLVIKAGKIFKQSEYNEVQEIYKREAYVYDKIFPTFREFEKRKTGTNTLNFIPKCFRTLFSDGRDILVLDNLRKKGFEPHSRLSPLNLNHLKAVLKNYAKFHAVSFAFKDQKIAEYQKLTENYSNVYKILTNSLRSIFQYSASKSCGYIKEVDEVLARKIEGIVNEGIVNVLDEKFAEIVEDVVITHGDGWNSNFLFKYEGNNKDNPSEVAILDWQLSSLHSPIVDLSYFMFLVSSEEQIQHFGCLLEYYHHYLSTFIKELGSDPEKLFPLCKVFEHWKKFSVIGFICALSFMEMVLTETDEVQSFDDFQNEEEMVEAMAATPKIKNFDSYLQRILSVSRYYFDLVEK